MYRTFLLVHLQPVHGSLQRLQSCLGHDDARDESGDGAVRSQRGSHQAGLRQDPDNRVRASALIPHVCTRCLISCHGSTLSLLSLNLPLTFQEGSRQHQGEPRPLWLVCHVGTTCCQSNGNDFDYSHGCGCVCEASSEHTVQEQTAACVRL